MTAREIKGIATSPNFLWKALAYIAPMALAGLMFWNWVQVEIATIKKDVQYQAKEDITIKEQLQKIDGKLDNLILYLKGVNQ